MGEVSQTPRFQSLDTGGAPWSRLAWSLALNAAGVLMLIAIPVTVHEVIQPQSRVAAISLDPPPVVQARPRPRVKIVTPPPAVRPSPTPKVEFHAPPVKPIETKTIAVPAPPVAIPQPVQVARVEAPKIDLPARPVIKEEVFVVQPAAPAKSEAQAKAVKTGGFGDPNGVRPAASSNKALLVQNGNAFDLPGGPGSGGGKPKVIASAGFGSAAVGESGGTGHAPVRGAGFGEYDASAKASPAAKTAAPVETPVEITFKPRPLYTAEAREKKIEGEVQLEVSFTSAGQIHVLRVVHGLGFGLDENARNAAGQIRFRPATRNGSPVDMTGVVHIVFELS